MTLWNAPTTWRAVMARAFFFPDAVARYRELRRRYPATAMMSTCPQAAS